MMNCFDMEARMRVVARFVTEMFPKNDITMRIESEVYKSLQYSNDALSDIIHDLQSSVLLKRSGLQGLALRRGSA